MDVYEKPTGRSVWLLGLVALRELLQYHNRQNLSSTVLAHSAYFMFGIQKYRVYSENIKRV